MLDDMRSPVQQIADQIEAAAAGLFSIQDRTLGIQGQPDAIRLRGQLLVAPEQAYAKIASRLREMGYTAELRHDAEQDLDVLLAVPGIMPETSGSRIWVNVLLYILTVLAVLFVGATWSDQVPAQADLTWVLTHLWIGWPFALSLMVILTGHELGHYFAGRYYKVPVSLPYFIPMPIPPLGTMGAFIVMKGRSVNRRQMLTVGAAGPLTGFLLAIPILILGLSLSSVQPMSAPAPGQMVFMEGNSVFYLLLKFAFFGHVLPGSGAPLTVVSALREVGAALFGTFPVNSGYDVFIHPVAMAGWAGLLVTALNLLPVGQLDGGHVLYSLVGQRAKLLTWPIIFVLVAMGLLLWPGWFLWAGLIFLFGQSHPEPLDDVTRLDLPRKIVAVAVLLIFIATFTPMPMQLLTGEAPALPGGQSASCLAAPGLLLSGAVWFMRRLRGKKGILAS
jgi:membrane-associated protease RseP (regulator of RpoE activity)